MKLVIEPSLQKFLTHFSVLIHAGSLSDPENKPGLAYFATRALLRGTKKKNFHQLSQEIEVLGGSLALAIDQSETLLRGSVLTQNLDPFLDLIQEVLMEPGFEPVEMDLLKKILEGELEQSLQDPRTLVSRALLQKAYFTSPVSRPPEGTMEGLAQITPADLHAWFKKFVVSENIVFGVTSFVEEGDLKRRIESRLKDLRHGPSTISQFPSATFPAHRQAIIVDREEMSTVPLFLTVPGISDRDPDSLALEVGNFVFGDDFTARLMQVLRAQNGWTYGAYSGYGQLLGPKREAGLFSIYLFPSAEHVEKAAPKTLELFEEYVSKGLSEDEFRFAQEALSNRYPFRLDSAEKRLGLRIREIATGRPYQTTEQYRARLSSLDRNQVNDRIAKRTSTGNLIIAAAGEHRRLESVFSQLPGMKEVHTVEVTP